MKLLCCVWSHEALLFAVEFEPEEKVEELKKVIASANEVNVPASHVTLYHASIDTIRLKSTMQLNYTTDPSLQKAIYDGRVTEMENAMTVGYYKSPDPEEKEINIVVEIHPHSIDITTHRAGSVGLPVESSKENIGLGGLWQYGALELLKPPCPDRFPVIFRRRLPFRVRVRDQKAAAKLFQEDGPELRCDDLSVLIDAILMTHEAEMGKGVSKHSCQRLQDQLLGLTSQICRANGYNLKLQRKDSYDIESQQRPDITVFCNGCLVLCGLEMTGSNNRSLFHEKMERWDPLVFGEMPYTLCYTTDGKHISLYALSPSNNRGRLHHLTGFSLTGDAIRVFYHLAFIFERMTTWSKVTLPTPLSPFKPYETKRGSIELLKGSVQLTFKRDRCADSLEFKRITDIYKNMKKLNMPSRSGLQTVRNLKCTSLFSPKLVVELSPVGYYRVPANVKEVHSWLRSMLYALTSSW